MSRSYVETFFRHKYLLILPIVLGLAVGTAVAFQAPRKYVVKAAFWADTRVPKEATAGTTIGPASGQATLLQQYLNTRSFMSSVVSTSPLAEEFRAADTLSAERLLTEVAGKIQVSTPGPQLVVLTVTTTAPEESKGIAAAALKLFEEWQIAQNVTRAKALAEYDRQQMESAKRTRDRAHYLAAKAEYAASKAEVASAASSGIQVIDNPDVTIPQARRKTIAFGAAGGMLAGLTLSVLALILLMAGDHSVRGESEAEDALGQQIAGSIQQAKRMPHPDRSTAGMDGLVEVGS